MTVIPQFLGASKYKTILLIELKPESKSVYGGRRALIKFTHASYRRVYVSTEAMER